MSRVDEIYRLRGLLSGNEMSEDEAFKQLHRCTDNAHQWTVAQVGSADKGSPAHNLDEIAQEAQLAADIARWLKGRQ